MLVEQLVGAENHKGLHSIAIPVKKREVQVCNSVALTDISSDFILWHL